MEGPDGSPPQSICMIKVSEFFPKAQMEKEDIQLTVPFQELAGESVKYLGRTDGGILALSNYRVSLLKSKNNIEISIPLGLIEFAQARDLFHLEINCKDASTVKCSFETAEQCTEWQRRIQLSIGVPETLESLFAFAFYSWLTESKYQAKSSHILAKGAQNNILSLEQFFDNTDRMQRAIHTDDFRLEVERLGFDINGAWRISEANKDFKLCASYPQKLLVPFCITDETLQMVSNFRGSRRLPVVVWRHKQSGAVIARSSQPEVGWLGWRCSKDEELLKALADACAFDRNVVASLSTDSKEIRKVLIVDARSYTSAVTNRARGGGCECIEYYPCAEIEFMNLGNIHVIRKSFHALRQLCASSTDTPNWLGLLEKTMWLQHLAGLLAASMTVVHAIEKKGRPVLVHCSDGWDRTPQIVATAQLCLDPYYRTVEGFKVLVEREWLSFGHKFADRCGHGPGSDELNERCPVFLQWLDLVHQIHKQNPCAFEFSMGYLIKLAQHSLSCLFGTFLCNNLRERISNCVFERTFSVWPFLAGPMYRNPLYVGNRHRVIWPACYVRDLSLWSEVYLGSLGNQNTCHVSVNNAEYVVPDTKNPMVKTRSYGDLKTVAVFPNGMSRRSSDPNMSVDPSSISSSDKFLPEMNNECEVSSKMKNLMMDTTCQMQELTCELKNYVGKLTLEVSNDESDSVNLWNKSCDQCNNDEQLGKEQDGNNSLNNHEKSFNANTFQTKEVQIFKNHNMNVELTSPDVESRNTLTDDPQSLWHGGVYTSTGTLIDAKEIQFGNSENRERTDFNDFNSDNFKQNTEEFTVNVSNLLAQENQVNSINTTDAKAYCLKNKNFNSTSILPSVHNRTTHIYVSSASTASFTSVEHNMVSSLPRDTLCSSIPSTSLSLKLNNLSTTSISQSRNHVNRGIHITNENEQSLQPRRRFSSNSKNEDSTSKPFDVGSAMSGAYSPPIISERTSISISCPDGLAHALSEQNIRLQQIVNEHKIREDALIREIHDMRMALLKKVCPNCNGHNITNEEQCSTTDNVENASNCSWEAVEDQSSPSSCNSLSQSNTSSVLWVPDHAVSRCTTCQTEFWLGRRKHHCRSCGQIFCADCSEFWAPLPDEKLVNPVRLCGPCYQTVTMKMSLSQRNVVLHQQNADQTLASTENVTAKASMAATSQA